tara:strand:- start:40 stop:1116 length:1077 start_codon:yes stop_codon:yes gene_type:complete
MNDSDINDKRAQKEFKGITFSNYKKSAAKKELLKYLKSSKIEDACYWCAEFICAGHFLELWEILFLFSSNNIHLGNPLLPTYLNLRFNDFKSIANGGYIGNELKMRNNDKIRRLFAEIISIICQSKKKNSFDVPKIKEVEYGSTHLTTRLKAESILYVHNTFRHSNDPKELFIAVNELAYNITKRIKNSSEAFYWIEWIIGFESQCKKNSKVKLLAGRRNYPVENKYQTDIIWLIWDIVLNEAYKRNNAIKKISESLNDLFCVRYQPGSKKKRKFMLYFAISLLTEPFDIKIPLFKNENAVKKMTSKINIIYQIVKKNEIKPATDYLFNNSISSGNLEKTISKLDKMNKLTNMVPRNK